MKTERQDTIEEVLRSANLVTRLDSLGETQRGWPELAPLVDQARKVAREELRVALLAYTEKA